jgi:hypothetical protein
MSETLKERLENLRMFFATMDNLIDILKNWR